MLHFFFVVVVVFCYCCCCALISFVTSFVVTTKTARVNRMRDREQQTNTYSLRANMCVFFSTSLICSCMWSMSIYFFFYHCRTVNVVMCVFCLAIRRNLFIFWRKIVFRPFDKNSVSMYTCDCQKISCFRCVINLCN